MSTAPAHPSLDLPICILVEDSDEDADTVAEAFRLSGVPARLHRVTNGDECLALLRRSGPTQPAALVLMDLSTPGMDGRDALRQIKEDARHKAIPVVVTTASANPRDLEFCYGVGANAYHVKPVSHPQHLDAMIQLLRYWLGAVTLPVYRVPTT